MLLVNARIRTLDPAQPHAEALAIDGGRIVAVGSAAACARALPGAEAKDLGGAVVLPGLIDAHGHLLGLGQFLSEVNLVGAANEAELVERVRTAAPRFAGRGWIRGFGWNQESWPDRSFPTHHALSLAFPDRPVWLTRIDGHAGLANEAAMRLAGIGPHTPDPAGGRLLRDQNGAPTGVLIDAAMEPLAGAIPPLTPADREALLLSALRACAEVGLTAVHDAGMDGESLALLERLDEAGSLPLRVYAMVDANDRAALERSLSRGPWSGRQLTVRTVKLFLDGALGSRGAAFFDDYADDPGNRGLTLLDPDRFRSLLRRIHGAGFQAAVHAIGDRANAEALDGFEAAGIPPAARPRIEHAEILRPADVPRAKRLGVIASMQPSHLPSDMPWGTARLGPCRLAGAFAWRALLEAGVPLAFGSDFPIEPPDPRRGLHAAITHQDERGEPPGGFLPEGRLDAAEAIRGFTSGAAFAAFAEERAGRIAPGFDADLTVLDRDPLGIPPREILQARILATVVAGRFVHQLER